MNANKYEKESSEPVTIYEFRIQGHLDARWSHWFGDMDIVVDGNCTTITGRVMDQAALHGLLNRIRDLKWWFRRLVPRLRRVKKAWKQVD